MSWFKRKIYPQFWQNYIAHFKEKQQKDIKDIRFIIFDTETTGLNPKKDRILSIGCIGAENYKIRVTDQLESYLNQDQFNAETVKIHGLLKKGSLSKIDEEKAIIDFLDYIKNAILVAHHAAFDIAMVNNALKRMHLPKLKNKVLDTGHLFLKTKLDTSKEHFSLDELSSNFNIPLHDRHTASGDAYITAILFIKTLAILNKKNDLKLKDLFLPHKRVGLF